MHHTHIWPSGREAGSLRPVTKRMPLMNILSRVHAARPGILGNVSFRRQVGPPRRATRRDVLRARLQWLKLANCGALGSWQYHLPANGTAQPANGTGQLATGTKSKHTRARAVIIYPNQQVKPQRSLQVLGISAASAKKASETLLLFHLNRILFPSPFHFLLIFCPYFPELQHAALSETWFSFNKHTHIFWHSAFPSFQLIEFAYANGLLMRGQPMPIPRSPLSPPTKVAKGPAWALRGFPRATTSNQAIFNSEKVSVAANFYF